MKSNINEKSNTEKEVKRYILVDDSDNRIIDSGPNQAVIEIGAKQYIKNATKSGKNASVSCYTYVKTIGIDGGEVSESAKKGSKSTMKLRISEARSSNEEANAYVVFRQYYNDYTGTWEPIAFWWGDGQPMTYGRVNIIEQDGNVPHMKTPRYVNDEADINYFSETKAFGSGDDGFDEFSDYVQNWLLKDDRGDGFDNVIYRTRLDRYGIRDAWMSRYK